MNTLTDKQREILNILFMLTRDEDFAIQGRAIAYWINGNMKWSTYRHKAAMQLVKFGYIEAHKVPRFAGSNAWSWYYRIPYEVKKQMEDRVGWSLLGTTEYTTERLFT